MVKNNQNVYNESDEIKENDLHDITIEYSTS